MDVLLAGGTGVLGRATLPRLLAAGHHVRVVVRDDEARAWVRGLGAEVVAIDLFSPDQVRAAADDVHAVVNLATSIPPTSRAAFASAWATNHRLRREAASNLAQAAVDVGAEHLVQESLGFAYADAGSAWLDEDTPLAPSAPMASIRDAEAAVQTATASGTAGVVLRFAQFYGPTSPQTRELVAGARRGLLTLFGRDEAYWPFVHVDDAAASVVAALDAPAGTYHVVDDDPLTRAEHATVLSTALGRRRLRRPPALLGRAGPVEPVARSIRPSNARFREATDWQPRYGSTREGWPAVVEALAASASASA